MRTLLKPLPRICDSNIRVEAAKFGRNSEIQVSVKEMLLIKYVFFYLLDI